MSRSGESVALIQPATAQRHERLGVLAATIAHDVNNYLAAALGNLDLLVMDAEDAPPAELLDAREAIKDCAALLGDLLAYARGDASVRVPSTARGAIEDALRLARPLLGDGVSVVVREPTAAATFLANRLQVQQVLVNLMVNAGTAVEGHGVVTVASEAITARHPGHAAAQSCVRLSVSDTGPGVPAELRARIFEPYVTSGSAARSTGLGLSIVRTIVEAHGGWVELDSEPGAGARFSAYFPCR